MDEGLLSKNFSRPWSVSENAHDSLTASYIKLSIAYLSILHCQDTGMQNDLEALSSIILVG